MAQTRTSDWYYDSAQTPGKDENKNMRGQVKDSDSSYVKLAKQGGHSDLLHYGAPDSTPSKTTSGEIGNKNAPPTYGESQGGGESAQKTSSASSAAQEAAESEVNWARQQRENNQRRNKNRSAPFYTTDYDPNKDTVQHGHGKKTFQQDGAGKEVNFNKLMSGGYGDDWRSQQQSQ